MGQESSTSSYVKQINEKLNGIKGESVLLLAYLCDASCMPHSKTCEAEKCSGRSKLHTRLPRVLQAARTLQCDCSAYQPV